MRPSGLLKKREMRDEATKSNKRDFPLSLGSLAINSSLNQQIKPGILDCTYLPSALDLFGWKNCVGSLGCHSSSRY